MNGEKLFLAIGGLESARLERTEQEQKKRRSGGRLVRRLLIAAAITAALIGTAYAAVTFFLYDSPADMITGLYGENTGFDQKEPALVSDPQKPWPNSMVQPGYEKRPIEQPLTQELEQWVSPVGQTVETDGYKLTVDAYVYDSNTQCGFITLLLEHEKPISAEELLVGYNGEIGGLSGNYLRFNQYGRAYLIPEKTTDTQLAFTYYFRADMFTGTNLLVSFPDFEEQARLEEYEQNRTEGVAAIRQRLKEELTVQEAADKMKELGYGGGYTGDYDDYYYLAALEYDTAHADERMSKETIELQALTDQLEKDLTPDEAVKKLRSLWGDALVDELFAGRMDELSAAAYHFLARRAYEQAHMDEMICVSLPDGGSLPYKTFGQGDIYVNSLCVQIRTSHYADEGAGAKKLVFHMTDGTDFVVKDEVTDNTLFKRALENGDSIYMLNSAIQIDDIASVELVISGETRILTVD